MVKVLKLKNKLGDHDLSTCEELFSLMIQGIVYCRKCYQMWWLLCGLEASSNVICMLKHDMPYRYIPKSMHAVFVPKSMQTS